MAYSDFRCEAYEYTFYVNKVPQHLSNLLMNNKNKVGPQMFLKVRIVCSLTRNRVTRKLRTPGDIWVLFPAQNAGENVSSAFDAVPYEL